MEMEGRRNEEYMVEERKWEDMNYDCLVHIFERVGKESLICDVSSVCKSWYMASLHPQFWKVIKFERTYFSAHLGSTISISRLVKIAIYRSRGMATEVELPLECLLYQEYFEGILLPLSVRCPALKSLTLPEHRLNRDQKECLTQLIHKWKDLEHLQVDYLSISGEFLSTFRHVIPNIAGFPKLLLAIVNSLPKLKYLSLRGSYLVPYEDLNFILARCRGLELLDLTNCCGIDAYEVERFRAVYSHVKILGP